MLLQLAQGRDCMTPCGTTRDMQNKKELPSAYLFFLFPSLYWTRTEPWCLNRGMNRTVTSVNRYHIYLFMCGCPYWNPNIFLDINLSLCVAIYAFVCLWFFVFKYLHACCCCFSCVCMCYCACICVCVFKCVRWTLNTSASKLPTKWTEVVSRRGSVYQCQKIYQSVHQRANGPAKYLSFQSFTPTPFPFPFLPTLATQWPGWATHVLKSNPSEANAKHDRDE